MRKHLFYLVLLPLPFLLIFAHGCSPTCPPGSVLDSDKLCHLVEDSGDADTGTDASTVPLGFVTRIGNQLWLDGAPYQRLGVNKYDLFHQFLGTASGNAGVAVTRPMALKALDDAAAAGLGIMRVSAVGYWPSGMTIYLDNETAWWAAFDEMIDAAEERGIKLVPVIWWNTFLFADMADEPLGETFAAESASRTLLFDYTRKLAMRYADSPTIAFWDLTNEINLSADLDYATRTDSRVCVSCGTPAARSAADNYATAEMVTTLVAMGQVVREEDPYHLISAGYSAPRESAWHLQASPEWTGADWTTDSIAELEAYVALVTPDPIDIVSIHIYQGDGNNQRLGVTGTFDPDAIAFLQDAADTINKPLYLGEFGDSAPAVSETPESNFARRSMWLALERRIPVSTHWVWEFYQFNTSERSAHSIEPGIDDALISVMSEVATRLADASTTRGTRLPVSNHDMEEDYNSDGLVDGWETVWREGTSTGWSAAIYNEGDVFEGSADLRLTSGTGDASSTVYALSDPVAVSAGSTVVLTFALREDVGGAESATFAIVEYDGDGTELVEHGRAVTSPGGWRFRVESVTAALGASAATVRVRFGAGGADDTIIDVDDVRLFVEN